MAAAMAMTWAVTTMASTTTTATTTMVVATPPTTKLATMTMPATMTILSKQ